LFEAVSLAVVLSDMHLSLRVFLWEFLFLFSRLAVRVFLVVGKEKTVWFKYGLVILAGIDILYFLVWFVFLF